MKYILSLIFIAFSLSSFSQGWSSWEEIYNKGGTRVSISFRNSNNSCDQGGKTIKYRFNIEGILQNSKKEIEVTIKYQNCQKIDVREKKILDLSNSGGLMIGINEGIDYTLTGDISEKSVRAEEITTNVPPTTYSNPSSNNYSSGSTGSTYQSRSSSSNKRSRRFIGMLFGLNAGFDMGSRPMIVNFFTESSQTVTGGGTNNFYGGGQKLVNPFGMGFRGDIMFHPVYRSNIHLGMILGGAYGGSLAMINGGTWKSENEIGTFVDKINYKYSKFDFGVDFAFGWTNTKYLIRYINSLQHHNFSYTRTLNYTDNFHQRSETIQDAGVYQTRRDWFSIGFRFSGKRGSRISRKYRSAPVSVDVYWNISRDNPFKWSDGDILEQAKQWQLYGFGFCIKIGRLLYISNDLGWNTISKSKLPTEVVNPGKTKNLYSQITLAYNFVKAF